MKGGISRDRRSAPSAQGPDKGTFRLCRQGGSCARKAVQTGVILSGPSLQSQDALSGGRDDLIDFKIPADPFLQMQPVQTGRRQDQGAVLSFIQFAQPGLDIAADALKTDLRTDF